MEYKFLGELLWFNILNYVWMMCCQCVIDIHLKHVEASESIFHSNLSIYLGTNIKDSTGELPAETETEIPGGILKAIVNDAIHGRQPF